jgi:hypothetical protein
VLLFRKSKIKIRWREEVKCFEWQVNLVNSLLLSICFSLIFSLLSCLFFALYTKSYKMGKCGKKVTFDFTFNWVTEKMGELMLFIMLHIYVHLSTFLSFSIDVYDVCIFLEFFSLQFNIKNLFFSSVYFYPTFFFHILSNFYSMLCYFFLSCCIYCVLRNTFKWSLMKAPKNTQKIVFNLFSFFPFIFQFFLKKFFLLFY